MNLEKRIKRHVIGSRHDFFAATLPGCETHCRRSLDRLSETIAIQNTTYGGVLFSGRLTDLYRANLHVRTAGRVLMRLASFKATAFHQLERKAAAIPWSLYLPSGAIPALQAAAHHSRLRHSGAIEERIGQSIEHHWSALGTTPVHDPGQRMFIRLQDDTVTISLDSSGNNLYQRGLKTHAAKAPLRETTAAFILTHCGFRADRPLMDPMCGSGTFSLEAALMTKAIPAGFHRPFAFMRWPAFRMRQWQYLKQEAARGFRTVERPLIRASDLDQAACTELSHCVTRHGLEDAISVGRKDFFSLAAADTIDPPGLIVLNPPYGRRLGTDAEVSDFYRQIAAKLTHDFKQWHIALLVPGKSLARRLPLQLPALPLKHGGLNVTLLSGRL
jgi:putative N6-adenine-specific DNA methylase